MTAVTDPDARASTTAPLPDRSVVPPVWSRITDLVVERGEGSWLVTTDGDRYLDYTSGIGVTNTGHAHPRVVAAIQDQAAKLLHGQQNIVYHEAGLRLYERLQHVLPGGPWSAFLSNSGAEAVEAAVKLARVATSRPAIIAFRYGFHGRTGQAMALTAAKDVYRGAFEPLPGSVYHASYPYCYQASGGPHDPSACTCDWEAQLDLLFHQLVYPDKVAGIIVEPVIGEGGYIVPSPTFMPRLREITREHGILLIADEVQTGFGRTGEMFAVRHWDVEPDIVVMAKGIASGLPLSGILARKELMDRLPPGSHGGTYGGNVVSCAAANATLDVIEDEGLVANARERGDQLLGGLRRALRRPGGRRRRPRPRPHGGHRAREARRGRRPGARPGAHQAHPARGVRAQAAGPDRRHLRQRHPDHPATRHDGRRGRPGHRDPGRGAGRRGSLTARTSRRARDWRERDRRCPNERGWTSTDTDQPGTPSAAVAIRRARRPRRAPESAEAIEAAEAIDAGPDTSFEDQERAVGIDPDARLPGEEGLRIILFGAIALFGIPAVLGGGHRGRLPDRRGRPRRRARRGLPAVHGPRRR